MTSIEFDKYIHGASELPLGATRRRSAERLRRALNLAAALVGLAISLPIMLLIAVAIKLTSSGPVLYRQTRVGLDRRRRLFSGGRRRGFDRRRGVERRRNGHDGTGGRRHCVNRRSSEQEALDGRRSADVGGAPFTIFKFRTMDAVAPDDDAQVWASPDDPRVTRLGRILRKYRMDELPQLANVLAGQMNIVGPRPEQPRIFGDLRDRVEFYEERQRVLPGITGWAQVNHRYDRCVDDVRRKVSYDLEYVAHRSPTKDLEIMLRTVPVMLFKRGAL